MLSEIADYALPNINNWPKWPKWIIHTKKKTSTNYDFSFISFSLFLSSHSFYARWKYDYHTNSKPLVCHFMWRLIFALKRKQPACICFGCTRQIDFVSQKLSFELKLVWNLKSYAVRFFFFHLFNLIIKKLPIFLLSFKTNQISLFFPLLKWNNALYFNCCLIQTISIKYTISSTCLWAFANQILVELLLIMCTYMCLYFFR